MQPLILIAVLAILAGAFAFIYLLRKLAAEPQSLPVTAEWIEELSVERYQPMLRMLDDQDLRFLRSQPGFTPKMARDFRAQRCRIFLGYLRWLQSDFTRVCTALRIVMVQSQQDRPDLAKLLLQKKISFALGLAIIHVNLLMYRWGLTKVDVTTVMAAFDSLRLELRQLVPAAAGAHA